MMNNNDINEPDSVNNGWHTPAGKFAAGNPGKQRGASKNLLRDEIKTFLSDNWKDFPTWFAALKPKEKIEALLALMPYALSRLQSIHMSDAEGNDLAARQATIDYSRLSEATLRDILAATNINEDEKQN